MTPAVALQRRKETITAYAHKLDVLEKLIEDGDLAKFPTASLARFAAWQDISLNVKKISRSVIYEDAHAYIALRERLERALALVVKARAKVSKKINIERDLREMIALLQEQSKSYVNQFTAVSAELTMARVKMDRLTEEVRRYKSRESLRIVK